MERLDPENNIFDIFIVDGASNFQVTGEAVEAFFTWVHTIHGADNVLALLFDKITKTPEIKVRDLCDNSSIFFCH